LPDDAHGIYLYDYASEVWRDKEAALI